MNTGTSFAAAVYVTRILNINTAGSLTGLCPGGSASPGSVIEHYPVARILDVTVISHQYVTAASFANYHLIEEAIFIHVLDIAADSYRKPRSQYHITTLVYRNELPLATRTRRETWIQHDHDRDHNHNTMATPTAFAQRGKDQLRRISEKLWHRLDTKTRRPVLLNSRAA